MQFNIGSSDKPKDSNLKGGYIILTVNADSSITNKDAVQVELTRSKIPYRKSSQGS